LAYKQNPASAPILKQRNWKNFRVVEQKSKTFLCNLINLITSL
jgi:hypothetical protein